MSRWHCSERRGRRRTISNSARKKVNGRHSRPPIGHWPVGIAEARRLAVATIVDLQKGRDPVAEACAALAVQATSALLPTVEQRIDEWQTVRRGLWSKRYAAEIARVALRAIIPAMGDRTRCQPWPACSLASSAAS